MNATPEDVRFVMIDPKRVELTPYFGHPAPGLQRSHRGHGQGRRHAAGGDRTRWRRATRSSPRWASATSSRYNKHPTVLKKLPYWVVIIDELADLMMAAPFEVEKLLCRLAQLARATGIHLVVATQRPSVDVITGLIKANFPTRIAFAVTSQIDSRTILDTGGAEKLLGRGDMLYMPTDASKPIRIQGVYVSDAEIERLVAVLDRRPLQVARTRNERRPARRGAHRAERRRRGNRRRRGRPAVRSGASSWRSTHTRVSPSLLQRRLEDRRVEGGETHRNARGGRYRWAARRGRIPASDRAKRATSR